VVFFLAFFSALEGGRSVSQAMLDNARLLGAGPLDVMQTIRLPLVLQWTFATVPNAVSFGLIVAVTASCRKPWPPAPTLSIVPWSSTSTTPTRWPAPTPPATFSAAQPNRHCHAARNRHESTPSTRAGADDGRYGR
jgi:hypothetical protein